MGKWILAMVLLSGCGTVGSAGNIRGSDGRYFSGGGEAVATAVAVVVFGTPDAPVTFCGDKDDPGPSHGCPETTPKKP